MGTRQRFIKEFKLEALHSGNRPAAPPPSRGNWACAILEMKLKYG